VRAHPAEHETWYADEGIDDIAVDDGKHLI
jgi:hypothetical protein